MQKHLVTCKGKKSCGCHRYKTVLVIVISKVQLLGANLHSTSQLPITAKCLCQFESSSSICTSCRGSLRSPLRLLSAVRPFGALTDRPESVAG